MKTMMLALVLTSCTSCIAARAADCHVDTFNFVWGQNVQGHLIVKSGKPCRLTVHTRGGGMSASSIPQTAQNGLVSSPRPYSWEYKSRTGYMGKDNFVVQMVGESMGRRVTSGTSNISMDVDVVP